MKFAARAMRVSEACIRSRSSRTSKRCAKRFLPESMTRARCGWRWRPHGAIDRDGSFINPTKSSCDGLAPHRHSKSSGDIAKTFSVTKLIDKLAAKYGRKLHEVPSASNTSANSCWNKIS